MKKLFVLFLTAVICLFIVACGGSNNGRNTETKLETEVVASKLDIENAIAETPTHIYDDVMENQARAMQNTYMMECTVGTITNEYFESSNIRIYLPIEELAVLNKDETIAVVCKLTEVIEKKDSWGITYWLVFGESQLYEGDIPDVAPRDHEIFTGLLKGRNNSYEGAWNIQIGDSDYLKLIYFAEGTDLSSYNESFNSGEEITFSVDISNTLTIVPEKFYNAKIISK